MAEEKQYYPTRARVYPGFKKIIVFVIILALIGGLIYLGFVGYNYFKEDIGDNSTVEDEDEGFLERLQNLLNPDQFNTYDPIINSDTLLVHPFIWRHILCTWRPSS